jgi:hypothetical protein
MRDLRACGERIAAKEPDRQLLNPYWSRDDDPVRGPRHRQNRSCDLMPTGTGAVIPQPRLTQQRQSSSLRMLGRRRLMILACGRIGQAEVWKWMFWPPSVALGSAWMRAERRKVPSIHLRDLYSNAYSPLGSSTSDRNPSKKRPGGRFLNACYHSVKLERAKRFELSTLTLARLCSTPELRPHRLDWPRCIKGGRWLQGENSAWAKIFPGRAIPRPLPGAMRLSGGQRSGCDCRL